jgi:glucose/arabinose dehydrogenase
MTQILRLAVLVPLVLVSVLTSPAAAAPGFHAAWVDQSPWPTLRPGGTVAYSIHFRNIGTETWQRGVAGRQVNLGTGGDSTAAADAGMAVGWLSANRVATTSEASVPPNAIATFAFALRAPAAQGTYRLALHPVLEGVQHLEDEGVFVLVVSDAGFHSAWVSQSPYPTLQPGQISAPLTIAFRNTGMQAWTKGVLGQEARLAINQDDAQWAPLGVNWLSANRVAAQTETSVPPGANGTFTFQVRAPQLAGTYSLHLRPVIDATAWMEDQGVFLSITVPGLPPAGGNAPTLSTTVVQSRLNYPWDLAFAPDGRMFVTERVGNVLVYASGAPGATQLANNPIAGIHAEGEAGAMGIAIDPAFTVNHFIYVCASRDDGGWLNQVLRYREANNALAFDGYVIRTGMYAGGNHDGCRIRFGPDGKLWVTMGEVGNTAFSQNPNSLNGKVLRVNSDGSIPEDNPILAGAFGRTAAYTMGHRNPQGIAFQPGTGLPFTSEHAHYTDRATGAHSHATVNLLRPGLNFSWPSGAGPGSTPPVWQSFDNPFVATSGNTFVSGAAWGAWSGDLFLAALTGTMLLRLEQQSDGTFKTAGTLFNGTYGRLRAAVQAPDGSLYLTTDTGNDRIIQVTPSQ